MKQITLLSGIFILIFFSSFISYRHEKILTDSNALIQANQMIAKDTCIIEGHTFRMLESKSSKKLKAYIKNSQIVVMNQGLQFAKYRVTYYIFSSLDDEQMPVIRHFNQRLSPPVLKVLKDAQIGNQFIFEEIIVVDPDKVELTNAVRPIVIERIKNQ